MFSSSIGKLWACCSVSFNHAAAAFLLTTAGNEVPLLFSNNGCPISRRAEREQSLYSAAVVLRERRLRSALLVCAPPLPRALL